VLAHTKHSQATIFSKKLKHESLFLGKIIPFENLQNFAEISRFEHSNAWSITYIVLRDKPIAYVYTDYCKSSILHD